MSFETWIRETIELNHGYCLDNIKERESLIKQLSYVCGANMNISTQLHKCNCGARMVKNVMSNTIFCSRCDYVEKEGPIGELINRVNKKRELKK